MAEFKDAVDFVLKNEGGFVDDPDDPGSATNFGISKRFLIDRGVDLGKGPGIITTAGIRLMPVEKAKELYYDYFWKPYSLSFVLDQVVATKIFDMVVNMGPGQAFKLVRNAFIDYREWDMPRGGLMDEQLLAALNTIQPYRILPPIKWECARFYKVLAHLHPRLEKYLGGWLKRASWPPEALYLLKETT